MHIALVITGAPLARRAADIIATLHTAGHDVTACLTDAARGWTENISDAQVLTGRIRPDGVVCCPGTFNTVNKWAAGINDTPTMGVLHDALGAHTLTLLCPYVNTDLANHPAWTRSLALLQNTGVDLLDPADGTLTSYPAPLASGTGDDIADRFQAGWITTWLEHA